MGRKALGRKQFNLRLPPTLAATVREEAKARNMPVSEFAEYLFRIGLRQHKRREVTERDRLAVMEGLRGKAIWPEVEADNG